MTYAPYTNQTIWKYFSLDCVQESFYNPEPKNIDAILTTRQKLGGLELTVMSDNPQERTNDISIDVISNQFLYLIIAQGFFAGLIIGKLAEGTTKSGLKHSFILVITAFLVSFGARILFG